MERWLNVDPSINRRQAQTLDGVKVQVAVSPYDVPEGVRGYREEGTNFFVIEFKYLIGDEPTSTVTHSKHCIVEVGIKSRRIYRIKVDVVALRAKTLGCEVKLEEAAENAINKTGQRFNHRLEGAYKLAKEAISINRSELFADLEHA